MLICAFGALIKEPLLSEHELLNVHPSLLPRWRGAAPIERAIDAGDEETGVTIMRPTAEFDAGPVCLQRAEALRPDDDYGSLSARLAALGGELLVEALDLRPPFREQPEEGITFAAKIEAGDRLLDPARSADELERRVRALTPHIGAYVPAAVGRAPRRGARGARARTSRRRRVLWPSERGACCSARPPARSSCSRSIRPASGPCRRVHGCGGMASASARPSSVRGSPETARCL